MQLVLSLFPGVDLFGRAFAQVGHCVVLGPDLLLDTRIEDFHAVEGRFDGVIGGPPCQNYSDLNRNRNVEEGDRLVREFLRVVTEAKPTWFVMENVRNVPDVQLQGYTVQRLDVRDYEFGGRQRRLRHIQYGDRRGYIIRPARTGKKRPVTPKTVVASVLRSHWDRHSRRCKDQGFELPLRSLTPSARMRVIGNGVPRGMGIAIAKAVLLAGTVTDSDCHCLCGRPVSPTARYATAACRQRSSRRNRGFTRSVTFAGQSLSG